jgi:hypothetical protein
MAIDWGIPLIKGSIHDHYLRQAYLFAWEHSMDHQTKTAAVITDIDSEEILGRGSNRYPEWLKYTPEQAEDTLWKRDHIIHSEDSAVRDMVYNWGLSILELPKIMYMPWIPCSPCSELVDIANVTTYIGHKQMIDRTPADWVDSVKKGVMEMKEAGCNVLMVDGKLGGVPAIMRGEQWRP